MRNQFDKQLDKLNTTLIEMGALCESAIASAAKSLIDEDRQLALNAIEYDKEIDRMEQEIE
ncbi:MAG: PhoU domain-containing protein, partial [Oscillospiraceae bacterium]